MKKLFALILAILMLTSLCACGETQETADAPEETENLAEEAETPAEEPATGVPNPMTEYASLDEINAIIGTRLCHPAVMGVSDEAFYTIDCGDYTIAQYNFSVNGLPYCFRASSAFDHDISGIYVGEGTAFADEPSGESIEYYIDDGTKAARWMNIDGQYVLSVEEPEKLEEETFKAIVEELYELTFPGLIGGELESYYASLEGDYQDSFSQRAMATVVNNGDSITITVSWSSSAFESTTWTMTAKRMEDGLLCYSDCTAVTTSFTEEGEELSEPYDFPAEGFFSENEGILYWNGAGDESCNSCTFEK